jgi:hypothetical protein
MDNYIYKEPLQLMVKYELSWEFRSLVESMQDCRIVKVIEYKTCELLQYWIDCPDSVSEKIVDMAFMTFIKNPEFQKYYRETNAFKLIAEQYLKEIKINQ